MEHAELDESVPGVVGKVDDLHESLLDRVNGEELARAVLLGAHLVTSLAHIVELVRQVGDCLSDRKELLVTYLCVPFSLARNSAFAVRV